MVDQLSDYGYNKSADATSLNSASLTGFPAFVRIEQSGDTTGTGVWGIDTNASIDGIEDFGFFDENGNALDFYAVTVDHTNGIYEFWVRLDLVRDGGTELQLGYGSGNTDDSDTDVDVFSNVPDLIRRYSLDETSGSAKDSTGNNDGTVTGATQGEDGVFKNSYYFDGSGDEVDTGISSASPPFVVAGWVYNNGGNDPERWFGNWNGGSEDLYFNARRNQANAAPTIVNDDHSTDNLQTSTDISLDEWHLMVYSIDSNERSFILDGQVDTEDTAIHSSTWNSGANFGIGTIGVGQDARDLVGRVAEVQIYNTNKEDEWWASHWDMSPRGGYSLFSANASSKTDQPGTVKESSSSLSIKTNSALSARTNPV